MPPNGTPVAAGTIDRQNPPTFNPRQNGTDYFWYSHIPVNGLASTAPTATAIINIDADSDFYCIALTQQASIGDAALTESSNVIPLVRLQITDTASGKSLMNTPLNLASIAGDGKRPYRLPRPRVFQSNGTIQLAFTSYVTAGTTYTDLQVILHGYKVYRS
jgi:hypothetical protein